ncbi:MAG TPA: hypothetical protein VMY77_05165 [Chitinophagaceae bacterium]|nr:hypothetical protein [Chitinophagaceae bacterium]
MTDTFEIQKNTKALSYTALICALFLAIAFLYKWRLQIPPIPAIQDLIEINLGNEKDGMGDIQPLVKGDPAPDVPEPQSIKSAAVHDEPSRDIQADEDDDKEAAPVTKPIKPNNEAKNLAKETVTKPVKTNNPVPVVNPNPAFPKPKIALYKGGNGTGGNGAAQDNGYKNQGYKGGNGDNGSPTGNPDSYGSSPGGRVGGPKVFGNRKIVRYYSFTGDLEKATIYAIVKVTPEGVGSFAGFGKNSSTTARAYANAIVDYLRNVKFDKADHESTVTVQFNFNIQ